MLKLIKANGSETLVQNIDSVFGEDPHIQRCCRNQEGFIAAIENIFVHEAFQNRGVFGKQYEKRFLDEDIERFIDRLFSRPFACYEIYHLYNFASDVKRLQLGDYLVLRDVQSLVQRLVGKEQLNNYHRSDCGIYFLIRERETDLADAWAWGGEWLLRENPIISTEAAFQLYKSEIICVDWGGVLFEPDVVNKIRNHHRFRYGSPRILSQPRPYYLPQREAKGYEMFLDNVVEDTRNIDGQDKSLATSIKTGRRFYHLSETRNWIADRLVHLIVSLECLLEKKKSDSPDKIAEYAASLIEPKTEKRETIMQTITTAYERRNDLIHKGKTEIKEIEVERLAEAVRRVMLATMTMFLRGVQEKKMLIWRLEGIKRSKSGYERISFLSEYDRFISVRTIKRLLEKFRAQLVNRLRSREDHDLST